MSPALCLCAGSHVSKGSPELVFSTQGIGRCSAATIAFLMYHLWSRLLLCDDEYLSLPALLSHLHLFSFIHCFFITCSVCRMRGSIRKVQHEAKWGVCATAIRLGASHNGTKINRYI